MNGTEFKRAMASCAQAAGCVAFGVTRAGPVRDAGRLRAWVDRGWHGDMAYLARDPDVRGDPRHLLPNARSVICVAVPYGPATVAPDLPTTGLFAQQFVGRDYHPVVQAILDALVAAARDLTDRDATWLAAVDTRPLLERSLAVQAGLGTIGRHTQLLVPGHGSMVALGVLLTDLELPPDAPLQVDPCGSCNQCLRACPSGALRRGRGLDARRCLAYWNTATRRAIPESLRARLGRRVYGCDTCQAACPWNAPAKRRTGAIPADLLGTPTIERQRLHRWLALSGRALKRELQDTALGWLHRSTLARTTCVVLGNLAQADSRDVLQRVAAEDRDPLVREHASWALERLQGA